MSYKIEAIDGCTKKLSFHFPKIDLTQKIKSALLNKQKEVNIKGFRKGKAPINLVEGIYRSQVENDALMDFISEQYSQAVEAESLRPTGRPSLTNTDYSAESGVKFDAIVEIFPTIHIHDLKDLAFEKHAAVVTDSDIDLVKKKLVEGKAYLEELSENNHVGSGHLVTINFQGHLGDHLWLPELSGKDVVLEVGSGKFLKAFEDALLGGVKGQLIHVVVPFPEDYHAEHLRGKNASFEIQILEVKVKKYPDFSDNFAKEYGHDSVEIFHNKIREHLMLQKTKEKEEELFKNILEKLIEIVPFDVPKSLVMAQEEFIKNDLKKTLEQQGMNEGMTTNYFEKWKDDISQKAMYQVRSGLILDTLAKNFQIETDVSDVEKRIDDMVASGVAKREDITKFYKSSPDNMRNLHYKIREEKTFQRLLEEVTVLVK